MAVVLAKDEEADYSIKPEAITPAVDTGDWPLLLKNYNRLLVRTGHFTPIPVGCTPLKRDLKSFISSGVINLDKPSNPSSHEVVAWVKRMLRKPATAERSIRKSQAVSSCVLIARLDSLNHNRVQERKGGIEVHEEVVLMTTKGEAIALGIAQMSTVELSSCDHGVVAKVKRCIMERDLYPRRWGLGPVALEKKKMKSDGKLDKYGRPNEATPAKWNSEYTDFNAPLENGTAPPPRQIENGAAASTAPTTEEQAEAGAAEKAAVMSEASKLKEEGESKKRKRHEGETPEEKAERKRKKKEKKEKRKSKGKDGSDEGSD
ncbi:H/ACA ribonucleoprotein complex subunit 4, partial [Lecanoromycetidae sp. Uapishka_2]